MLSRHCLLAVALGLAACSSNDAASSDEGANLVGNIASNVDTANALVVDGTDVYWSVDQGPTAGTTDATKRATARARSSARSKTARSR